MCVWLQFGIFGDISKWQRDLERLSSSYDTDEEGGLHSILLGEWTSTTGVTFICRVNGVQSAQGDTGRPALIWVSLKHGLGG